DAGGDGALGRPGARARRRHHRRMLRQHAGPCQGHARCAAYAAGPPARSDRAGQRAGPAPADKWRTSIARGTAGTARGVIAAYDVVNRREEIGVMRYKRGTRRLLLLLLLVVGVALSLTAPLAAA